MNIKISIQENVLFAWSGGKDSALALYEIQKTQKKYEITLLTTLTKDYDRTSMHGVRSSLLEDQARALGLKLEKMFISKKPSINEYDSKMRRVLAKYKAKGVSRVFFGDIFLEDLKKYREQKLKSMEMKAEFPLWKKNTNETAREFINLKFKAVVTCVDIACLAKKFAGRTFDEKFLSELPTSVDPMGENGEFHTFVYDGPSFTNPINFKRGECVLRDNRFPFRDLIPV